ncbi:hypothetical protein FQA47_018326 [Oryzias melastigma]|uniref:Uncharacterized protein n=1 Tax=Oryzias melastigma TaxID=30732 RepID=A0A834FSP7_ORYME|nr:hypothetical protein FQA47_018326 [Oryzias melastigma]
MVLSEDSPGKTKKKRGERERSSCHPKTQRRTKKIRKKSGEQQPSKDPPTQQKTNKASRPAAATPKRSSAAIRGSRRGVATRKCLPAAFWEFPQTA